MRQAQAVPGRLQRCDQLVHVFIRVHRPGGEAQSLGPARHGRIVDRLNIDAEIGDRIAKEF